MHKPKKTKRNCFPQKRGKAIPLPVKSYCYCDLLIPNATGDFHMIIKNYHNREMLMTMFRNFFIFHRKQILLDPNVTRNNRAKVFTASDIGSILADIILIV